MLAHCDSRQPVTFYLSASIVEGIIRDTLLAHDTDNDETTQALSAFKKIEPYEGESNYSDEKSGYIARVKNVEQFLLCLATFNITPPLEQFRGFFRWRRQSMVWKIGSCTAVQASRVSRIACAVNIETISQLLSTGWAFSVALDTSTVKCTGYLDIRLRLCVKVEIEDFHDIAIPLRYWQTGEVMFNAMAGVFDNVCASWTENVLPSPKYAQRILS
jgi:hypothetical protein